MLGVYDYTVILTYCSMISGVIGIIVAMTGIGHPFFGTLFLLISGLLDGFDGKVARRKKGRTDFEKKFGVQIDSMADLICFGVLPAAIAISLLRVNGIFTELVRHYDYEGNLWIVILLITIAIFYILAALIRLAYFNATTEERRETAEKTGIEYYSGLPVTSAALVFPLALVVHYCTRADLTIFYFLIMLIMAIMFVWNFKIKKPGKVGFTILILIGIVELVATIMILCYE